MKKSRFTQELMVKFLHEVHQSPIAAVAKKHDVSNHYDSRLAQTIAQLESVDVKRMRQLEQKNAKLKRLLAERDLKINLMKDVAAKLQKWRARRCVAGRSFICQRGPIASRQHAWRRAISDPTTARSSSLRPCCAG